MHGGCSLKPWNVCLRESCINESQATITHTHTHHKDNNNNTNVIGVNFGCLFFVLASLTFMLWGFSFRLRDSKSVQLFYKVSSLWLARPRADNYLIR
mgnify:CR=1 FL=1